MKADAEDFRLKRLAMEEQLGKQLVLSWTEEDEALSLSDWENDLATYWGGQDIHST